MGVVAGMGCGDTRDRKGNSSFFYFPSLSVNCGNIVPGAFV